MYQIPVGSLDVIRKTRRKIKHVLSDIGLEDCQNLLEKWQDADSGEDVFLETEWADFTEGFSGRGRKKWTYRTDAMCCSLCTYHTRYWRSFKYHVQRDHDFERNMAALSPCPLCPFVGHPKVVRKHTWLFHSNSPAPSTMVSAAAAAQLMSQKKAERYRCRKCSFRSSVLYTIQKHVLLTHLGSTLRQISFKSADQPQPLLKRYHCRECQISFENLDQMLRHVLVSAAHQSVNLQMKPFIIESRSYNTAAFSSPAKSQEPARMEPLQFMNSVMVTSSNHQLVSSSMTGAPNSVSFLCVPGNSLPPQASALVQLASAEAKGFIKHWTHTSFQSASPTSLETVSIHLGGTGPSTARLAISSSAASKQTLPMGIPGQNPRQPWTQVLQQPLMVTQKLPLNQTTPQGTMLTSQSLLSHLIPTGNKINGLPTYTLAPLKLAPPHCVETPQNTGSPLQPIKPTSNSLPQAKRWVACPICNELFPSDIYEVHTEVVHKATSRNESIAAKAPFLRKMPDKTVKCLICKVLVSEKRLLSHLLHGLVCMFCSQKFVSIKSFLEHAKEHNPKQKVYCDYIRQEYRLYTNSSGKLLFPYFDIKTTAPKEILGDTELNLALVTKSLDPIFLKMLPISSHPVCSTPIKTVRTRCLFCDENCQTPDKYQEHLRHKHFVDTTVHAILKTAAFKCIYCNGVYTGRVTQRAIVFHLRRCLCAPKEARNTEDSRPPVRAQVPLPSANKLPVLEPSPKLQNSQAPVFYFTQVQQGPVLQAKLLQAPLQQLPLLRAPLQHSSHQQLPLQQAQLLQTPVQQSPLLQTPLQQSPLLQAPLHQAPLHQAPVPSPNRFSCIEPEHSKGNLRLEMAWKEAMESNKRERQQKAAVRQKQETEKEVTQAAVQPEVQINSTVQLALLPSKLERQHPPKRKAFLTRYFHKNPYVTRKECDELSKRLLLTKSEIALLFGKKRARCRNTMRRHAAVVFLGFNMAELNKVRHNLLIPEVLPADLDDTEEPEKSEEATDNTDSRKQSEEMEVNEVNEEEPVKAEREQHSDAVNDTSEPDK